jgi:hypothetical protein
VLLPVLLSVRRQTRHEIQVMFEGVSITGRVVVGGLLVIAGVYAIETHSRELQPEEELA